MSFFRFVFPPSLSTARQTDSAGSRTSPRRCFVRRAIMLPDQRAWADFEWSQHTEAQFSCGPHAFNNNCAVRDGLAAVLHDAMGPKSRAVVGNAASRSHSAGSTRRGLGASFSLACGRSGPAVDRLAEVGSGPPPNVAPGSYLTCSPPSRRAATFSRLSRPGIVREQDWAARRIGPGSTEPYHLVRDVPRCSQGRPLPSAARHLIAVQRAVGDYDRTMPRGPLYRSPSTRGLLPPPPAREPPATCAATPPSRRAGVDGTTAVDGSAAPKSYTDHLKRAPGFRGLRFGPRRGVDPTPTRPPLSHAAAAQQPSGRTPFRASGSTSSGVGPGTYNTNDQQRRPHSPSGLVRGRPPPSRSETERANELAPNAYSLPDHPPLSTPAGAKVVSHIFSKRPPSMLW